MLVTVLFFIRRRRDRQRLARLRATEPPDAPAFWLEDPDDPRVDDVPVEEETPPDPAAPGA